MKKRIAIVMDPIEHIRADTDGGLAMFLEAQYRDWEIYYIEFKDLFCQDGVAWCYTKQLKVHGDRNKLTQEIRYEFVDNDWKKMELGKFDVILMRKDPPFDIKYIYSTYILDLAKNQGALVINDPTAIRDGNEKLFILQFPQCISPTLVTSNQQLLQDFIKEQHDVILKPLDSFGGNGVFHLHAGEENIKSAIEILTTKSSFSSNDNHLIMAQRYIPEISVGDKRIFLINGEAIPYAYLRHPVPNDFRTDIAGKAIPLTENDKWICEQIGPILKEKGLYFVGIDVIGNFLTEINVTSPTLFRQLEEQCKVKILQMFFDWMEEKIS